MVGHHSFRTKNSRNWWKDPPFLNKPTAPPFATHIHPTSFSGQGNEYADRIRWRRTGLHTFGRVIKGESSYNICNVVFDFGLPIYQPSKVVIHYVSITARWYRGHISATWRFDQFYFFRFRHFFQGQARTVRIWRESSRRAWQESSRCC